MKKTVIFSAVLAISTLLVGCKKEDIVNQQTLLNIDEHNIMLNTKPRYVYIDLNDGSNPRLTQVKDYSDETKLEVNVYSRYSLMVPKREGYIFKGFSTDQKGEHLLSETETTVLDNYSTIYANWMPVPMDVYVLEENASELDVDLGIKMLPIEATNSTKTIFVPYHYKEVLLEINYKANNVNQNIFIGGMSRDGLNKYNYNASMPYSIRLVDAANLYNIEMLGISYMATDLGRVENYGSFTTLGYSIRAAIVQSFREAYIKIK